MRIRTLPKLLVILSFLLVFLGGYVWWARATCQTSDKMSCNLRNITSILEENGIASALEYVERSILPRNGYSLTHMYLHVVGEYAYIQEGELEGALKYLKPYEQEVATDQYYPYQTGLDGFVHGVLSAYFRTLNPTTFPEHMKYVCNGGMEINSITENIFTCYHALGHALVHASGNQIAPALAVCDSAEELDAREGCYFGSFMELAHLYSPAYHPGVARPDSQGDSLQPLCESLSPPYRSWCAHFIGETYLVLHPNDFKGAFLACAKIPDYQVRCVSRLGHMIVTQAVAGPDEVDNFCTENAGTLAELCSQATYDGFASGYTPIAPRSYLDWF